MRMKSMLKSVEIHKYIKDTTYLEKSHTCNRNRKQSKIQTRNLFSVVQVPVLFLSVKSDKLQSSSVIF